MENASKALIMAASILIGIMILSLAVFMFMNFASTSSDIHEQVQQDQINQFNTQFTSYVDKEGITIHDVVTVANLAKENNQYYDLTENEANNYYIAVVLKRKTGSSVNKLEQKNQQELEELIKEDMLKIPVSDDVDLVKLKQYSCTVEISEKTSLVKQVKFEEK